MKEGRTHDPREQALLKPDVPRLDLKICISGVKVHQDAGWRRRCNPGPARSRDGREYNHTQILTKVRNTARRPQETYGGHDRRARFAKVDYTVQILYNTGRADPSGRRHRGRTSCRSPGREKRTAPQR
jgi:hypothetical protein